MQETRSQTHRRLLAVIANARFEALAAPYAWRPMDGGECRPTDNAIAAVKDGSSWYVLSEAPPTAEGTYRIFSFHFAEGSSASGFVAWLAALMKEHARTGAIVVCGFDARNSPAMWQTSLGLFDYWGCPWSAGDDVASLINRLRRDGSLLGCAR
jgi:hypothetical protein